MVILLIAFLSVYILHVPSFLGVNNAGTAHGLMLSLTTPLLMSSVTYSTLHVVLDSSYKLLGWIKLLLESNQYDVEYLSLVVDHQVIH